MQRGAALSPSSQQQNHHIINSGTIIHKKGRAI
jgi:hypothetical protein